MTYGEALDTPCPLAEVTSAAGLEPNAKFGEVLAKLLELLAQQPRKELQVQVHVSFDRDGGDSGLAEDGMRPLMREELRDVLQRKITVAKQRLTSLEERLATMNQPQDVTPLQRIDSDCPSVRI